MTTIRRLNADELMLEQALGEGMHAGLMGREASTNPYQESVPEHAEWERGRAMAAYCSLAGMTA